MPLGTSQAKPILAGLALFSMFCVCVPAYSQAGAVVGYKGLALNEQKHSGSIFFFPFGFKSLKDTLSPNRRFWQKKFPTKMVTNLTNLTLPSAEVIYSLFGTYMCIRQNFVLLAYNGSECIPRHLSAWYIEMNDGLDGAGVHEGCESSTESLGREAVCGARREMLLNSQSNKEK